MKRNSSIQFKAAFLLIVFALNTVIGFACAVGLDMGFNSRHHLDEEATESTVHINGKKHQHNSKEDSEKGGCCNDKVIKFQNLDKSLNQKAAVSISTPLFTIILNNFFGTDIFKQVHDSDQKYILNFFHPPPPDIRILIRSFQI